MKKMNTVVVALAGALALVFCVSGFLLFRGIGQFSKAEKSLKRSVGTLRNYYAREPFPSSNNVAREQENGRVLRQWLSDLSGALREGQIEPIQKTPSNFVRLFSQKREELKEMATRTKTALPADFAFGFERYSVSGALPAPPDVPRLAQQLAIADELCRVLFDGGAAALTELRREEFESAAAAMQETAADNTVRRRRSTPLAAAAAPTGERTWSVDHDAGELGPGDLYTRLRFGVEFEAREAALTQIMNALAAHDMFAVVTFLNVEKPGSGVTAPAKPDGSEEGAMIMGNTTYPPRSQRLMSGPMLEQPMRITMEIDVYRFAELAGGKEA